MFTSEEMAWLEACPENDRRELQKTLDGIGTLVRVVDKSPRTRFKISSTSGRIPPHPLASEDKGWWVTFGSLEELLAWIRSVSNSVVVSYLDGKPELEIHDDYRE